MIEQIIIKICFFCILQSCKCNDHFLSPDVACSIMYECIHVYVWLIMYVYVTYMCTHCVLYSRNNNNIVLRWGSCY